MALRRGWHRGTLAATLILGFALCQMAPVFAARSPFRFEHAEPLNNLRLTPGARFDVALERVCTPGYSTKVRDVPFSEKLDVYREYGIAQRATGEYEIDHLIPLELGGSNAIANLWPQLNDHPRGYLNSKDMLENRLHELVCHGAMTLDVADREIASDWVATYHEVFGVWPPGVPMLRSVTGFVGAVETTTAPSTRSSVTHGQGVRITALLSVVDPGSYEVMSVFTSTADDSCVLRVTLPSGAISVARGLGAKRADQTGSVTWRWRIGTRTSPGTARVTVGCGAGSVSGSFVIS